MAFHVAFGLGVSLSEGHWGGEVWNIEVLVMILLFLTQGGDERLAVLPVRAAFDAFESLFLVSI